MLVTMCYFVHIIVIRLVTSADLTRVVVNEQEQEASKRY